MEIWSRPLANHYMIFVNIPWSFWNGEQSLCRSCSKKIGTKPGFSCDRLEHQRCYKKNVAGIKINRQEAQQQAFIHYSGVTPPRCVLCGFNDTRALQLDHINGDGAAFRKEFPHQSGKSLALWLRKRNWPAGYRTLCANCQCLEREKQGCDGRKKILV